MRHFQWLEKAVRDEFSVAPREWLARLLAESGSSVDKRLD